jgi:sterol desaturase/sphingolipid hydroxylase (fatty acid hydroxylase superfamily)
LFVNSGFTLLPMLQFLGPLGGGQGGRFFRILPPYVSVKSKPGDSVLPAPSPADWLRSALQLKHVWASPNLPWAIIALAFYFCFPYDLSPSGSAAAAPISLAFFKQRFPLWLVLVHGYTAFWHITLYWLKWSDRPLIPQRIFSTGKVLHNIMHSTFGIAQWVVFENVFAFLWASGRLAYTSDAEAASSWSGLAVFIAGLVAIPLWRDGAWLPPLPAPPCLTYPCAVHFYFSHRLLHFKPIFQFVHSLHHRNTDIEPFAGLCMHPVEHLYYYACILPNLALVCSPFHFLWNGVHLLLAPGASHSGFEDHFQADNFHYM